MTLAAAYLVGQVPIIVSDTLMTGGSRGSHYPVATRVDLEHPLPLEWMIPVSGLSRKSMVICQNLAVACAGNGFGASVICSKLRGQFAGKTPDMAHVKKALSTMNDALSESTCCTLVGWVVEGAGPKSFQWDSRTPDDFLMDADFIAGSGDALFREIAWSTQQRKLQIYGFDEAQHYALIQISSLLLNEITNGAPIQSLFGGGYDLLIWDGTRFRHGANVSFLFFSLAWLRSTEKTISDLAPILISQAEIEDCLVVRAILASNQLGVRSDPSERVSMIPPITSNGRHRLSQVHEASEIPYFADRIFVVITGTGPAGTPEHWSAGVAGPEAGMFKLDADATTGKIHFWLPMGVIDNMRAAAERQFNRVAESGL